MEEKKTGLPQQADSEQTARLAEFAKSQLAALEKAHGVHFERMSQLAGAPGGARVMALWKAGAELADAWAAVNLDRVMDKKLAALKQAALNSVYSKRHLVPARGMAEEDAVLPDEVYEQYRALVPNMTDSQIRADWRRYNEN